MEIIESNKVKRRIPEVVVFEDPRKRPKKAVVPNRDNEEDESPSKRNQAITMKHARFDVHKFGIQGFGKTKKEEAQVQLAISLGAQPPKNKFYNYKEYIAMKKEEKNTARQKWLENKDKAVILKTKKPTSKKNIKNTKNTKNTKNPKKKSFKK